MLGKNKEEMSKKDLIKYNFGDEYSKLYWACKEVGSSERKYQSRLVENSCSVVLESKGLDVKFRRALGDYVKERMPQEINLRAIDKYGVALLEANLDEEFIAQLGPYLKLSRTSALKHDDDFIEESFLSGDPSKVIKQIVDDVVEHFEKEREVFTKLTSNMPHFENFCASRGIVNGTLTEGLSGLPIQRGPRYLSLLKAIRKESKCLSERLDEEKVKQFNDVLDRAIEKVGKIIIDIAQKKNEQYLADTVKDKNLVKLLDDIGVIAPPQYNLKETGRMSREVVNAIKRGKPEKIVIVLGKYKFTTSGAKSVDLRKANAIKQKYYFSQLNPTIRDIMEQNDIDEIRSEPNMQLRVYARIKGFRSSTAFLINEVNKAYKDGDSKKMDKSLSMLGIKDQKKAIVDGLKKKPYVEPSPEGQEKENSISTPAPR